MVVGIVVVVSIGSVVVGEPGVVEVEVVVSGAVVVVGSVVSVVSGTVVGVVSWGSVVAVVVVVEVAASTEKAVQPVVAGPSATTMIVVNKPRYRWIPGERLVVVMRITTGYQTLTASWTHRKSLSR